MILDADSILVEARKMAEFHRENAIECARKLRDAKIPYVLGGKTKEEGLDCSGLTRLCYRELAEGALGQYNQLSDWLFDETDIACGSPGDLVFFSELANPDVVSHNGIISQVNLTLLTFSIIGASSVKGCVAEDELNLRSQTFGSRMLCKGVAKMRPFLTRQYIQEQIEKLTRE